jgi:FkbM family methyltransferase
MTPIQRMKHIVKHQSGLIVDVYQFLKPSPDGEVRFFEEFLGPSDIVLDSGANKGAASIRYSMKAKFVFALEPNPHAFRRLRINTFFRKNIKAINAGLWDNSCNQKLFLGTSNNPNVSKASSVFYKTENFVTFQAYALDDLNLPLTVLCLDLEGAEFRALVGSKRSLDRIRLVAMETHMVDGKGTLRDCERFLKGYGFESHVLKELNDPVIETFTVFSKVKDFRRQIAS